MIVDGQYEQATLILEQGLLNLKERSQWQAAFDLVVQIPSEIRLDSLIIAPVYAQILMGTRQVELLLEFSEAALKVHEERTRAKLLCYQAQAFFEKNQLSKVIENLKAAIPFLENQNLGFGQKLFGLTEFMLGNLWEKHFLIAEGLLEGRQLGFLYLDYGYCFSEAGRIQKAIAKTSKALRYFKQDFYFLAWTRFNLGQYASRANSPEAERHLLECLRLTQNPKAAEIRPMALNALAFYRRSLGEWARAEFLFRESMQIAVDNFDRQQAILGLARTLRLSGRVGESLEVLEETQTSPQMNVEVVRALSTLALNDLRSTRECLDRVPAHLTATDAVFANVARAELARREGRLDEAVNHLESIPVNTLHAREEVRAWPELFALRRVAGKPTPEPLEYPDGLMVQVRARGSLKVSVNTRAVAIAPTGRVGELLVFLLEHSGTATLERIMDAMFPDAVEAAARNRARKAIWKLVESLRHVLGWASSVIALRGAYSLDPNVTWEYDVQTLRDAGKPSRQ